MKKSNPLLAFYGYTPIKMSKIPKYLFLKYNIPIADTLNEKKNNCIKRAINNHDSNFNLKCICNFSNSIVCTQLVTIVTTSSFALNSTHYYHMQYNKSSPNSYINNFITIIVKNNAISMLGA